MENEKPNYYAIIPADVRYDKELKDKAKLLYGEITSLCNEKGYCYASNKYFANLFNVSTRTITNLISSLIEKKYLKKEIVYKNNSKEVLQRRLYLWKKNSIPLEEIFYTPLEEIFQENNKYINNKNNNNKKENIKRKKEYFEDEELNNLFIEFLNQRKKLKAVNSDRAIQMLINKLNDYDDDIKKQMIENSIVNSWKGLFELKNNSKSSKETTEDMIKRFRKEIEDEERRNRHIDESN